MTQFHPDTQAMKAVNNNQQMAGSGAAGCRVSTTPLRVPMPSHSHGVSGALPDSTRDRITQGPQLWPDLVRREVCILYQAVLSSC